MTKDVAIVGAGPVGLHAALKAALLNMYAIVVDKSRRRSRAFFIPRLENIPALPGVSGAKLIELQRQNLDNYRDKVQIVFSEYRQSNPIHPRHRPFQNLHNLHDSLHA